jgi:hypothetical protein
VYGAMNSVKKTILMILGGLAAIFVVSQLVLGQLILSGRAELKTAHQHSGYTAVLVSLAYIALSLAWVAALPTRPKS